MGYANETYRADCEEWVVAEVSIRGLGLSREGDGGAKPRGSDE